MTKNHYRLTVWERDGVTLAPHMSQGFLEEKKARDDYHRARNAGNPCRLEFVTVLEEYEGS